MAIIFNILVEDFLFFGIASAFLAIVGWAWRETKPYSLPHPLPAWFSIWFATVQIGGGLLPLGALLFWGWWRGNESVLVVLISYLVMLGLQILSEKVTLDLQIVVWVMVPYLYIPYRIWQLFEGLGILSSNSELIGVRNLLLFNIVLWIVNYCLDLAQLPRLLRWELREEQLSTGDRPEAIRK